MSKKETKEMAKAAEQQEQERRRAIADFNVNQMGKLWIDPDKVPTDEDIENAKKEFEEFTKQLNEKNDYLVADKANALRVAKFMQEFVDHNKWSGREFVGVLRFHAQMDDFIKDFDEANPVDLILDYGAMQFAFLMFKNYGGVGVESANWVAERWEEYIPIFEKLYELNNWYELQVHKSENMKQKWAAMSQGYFMNILEGADEDIVDASTVESKDDAQEERISVE